MEEVRKPRKTHIKIIHHHVHHYHYHRGNERDQDFQQEAINRKHSIYSRSHRTHRHHHRHHSRQQHQNEPEIPNKSNRNDGIPPKEYDGIPPKDNDHDMPNDNKDYSDEYNPIENDNSNDNQPYEYDDDDDYDNKPKRPKPQKPKSQFPKKIVTYYIPETPGQGPKGALPPETRNKLPKKRPKSPDKGSFPYPIEKLKFLKQHPLPDGEPMEFGYPNMNSPAKPPRRIRFISDYPKYQRPKNESYNYWTEIEAVLIQERLGGYNEIPPKQLPMMYPFTQMSPRKLPWDFSDVELVPTRPNKPMKPFKPKSFSYYEESILQILRIPTPGNRPVSVSPRSDEFEFVESWLKTCLWKPFKKLTSLTRLGLSSLFLEFERSYQRIHLVIFPCDYPLKYANNPLPDMIVTHRFVSNGFDLIYLLKKIKKIKVSFLLCAADLGNEAIDYHPKCIPTQFKLDSLIKSEFDSFFYRESGVESILILDSSRVVPLYACQMSYR